MGNYLRIIGLLIIGIGLICTAIFLPSSSTGKTIESYEHTYTKAICNKSNFCQDYLIKCENNSVREMNPITGAVTQHSKDWTDPRGINTENYCKN